MMSSYCITLYYVVKQDANENVSAVIQFADKQKKESNKKIKHHEAPTALQQFTVTH